MERALCNPWLTGLLSPSLIPAIRAVQSFYLCSAGTLGTIEEQSTAKRIVSRTKEWACYGPHNKSGFLGFFFLHWIVLLTGTTGVGCPRVCSWSSIVTFLNGGGEATVSGDYWWIVRSRHVLHRLHVPQLGPAPFPLSRCEQEYR